MGSEEEGGSRKSEAEALGRRRLAELMKKARLKLDMRLLDTRDHHRW